MTTHVRWILGTALGVLLAACTSAPADHGGPLPPPTVPTTTDSPHRSFYVSPRGSDHSQGGKSAPWQTLKHALPMLRPGDQLTVMGGTYRERVTDVALRAGTPSRRIVVRADPGHRAVVRGLVWLDRPSYWTVDGLNVTWDVAHNDSREHLVKLTDGVGWIWRNSEIWGARSFADVLIASERPNEPADWALVQNCIHDTVPTNGPSQDSNIYVGDMQTAGAGLIERNLVFGAPNGRNIKLGGGRTADDTGPVNVTIRYNTLVDSVVPIVVAGGASDIAIEHNVLGEGHRGYLVRGFRLTGKGVSVSHNLGFGAASFFAAGSGSLVQGPDNTLLDRSPLQGPMSCDGFRPADAQAETKGRYAETGPSS